MASKALAMLQLQIGRLASAGWPMVMGVVAVICGSLLLIAAWYLDFRAQQILQAQQSSATFATPSLRKLITQNGAFLEKAPSQSAQLQDLMQLFALAKNNGIALGSVEYRAERSPSLPVLIRTVNLRVNEDYPRLKGFIAKLLGMSPYVSLQEIRIERRDAATPEGQALLRLSYIYKADPPPTKASP